MSPEQALGKRSVLDHRTDIYSLGVTLYELLTLRPAFDGGDRETLPRRLLEEEPLRPRTLNRLIPHDLETIVLKATAKEASQRYATAQQLADDLKRFLADEPVQARRPSLRDKAAKWLRRHRPLVWSAVSALLLIVVAMAVSIVSVSNAYRREKEQRTRAEDHETMLRHFLYAADLKLAHAAWKNAELAKAAELLSRHLPGPGETDLRPASFEVRLRFTPPRSATWRSLPTEPRWWRPATTAW